MTPITAPFQLHTDRVRPEWIDNNGHMNMGYYMVVFDYATDDFLDACGLTRAHREAEQVSTFALEAHINYLQELKEGDPLVFRTILLGHDAKRIHAFFRMFHATEGFLSATSEQMCLHVDLATRRSAEMPAEILANVDRLATSQKGLPWPEQAGQGMRIRRKS